MYSEKVMEHFANPRNVGEIEDANAVGTVGNAKCGDIMKMYMKIEDGVIKDVKFKTIAEALELTNKAVIEALDGLPPAKIHCSVLAEDAIKAAIVDYYKRQGLEPPQELGCSGDCAACAHGHDHVIPEDK